MVDLGSPIIAKTQWPFVDLLWLKGTLSTVSVNLVWSPYKAYMMKRIHTALQLERKQHLKFMVHCCPDETNIE